MSDWKGFYRDKTVLITGASSGIGAELARVLGPLGARVAVAARRKEMLQELAGKIASEGGTALALPCDVTDEAQCLETIGAAESTLGPIDVAILNAGGQGKMGVKDFSVATTREVFDLNFFGVLHFAAPILAAMRERGSGTIAATSSIARDRGMPGFGAYSASKSALSLLFEAFRVELGDSPVRVVTIEPGFVKSPLTDKNKFPMPFMLETRDAVEIILRGVAAGARVIRFPWQLSSLSAFSRILPPRLFDRVMAKAGPKD